MTATAETWVPPLVFTVPLQLVSESNAHTHWRYRQKRAKEQRSAAYWAARGNGSTARVRPIGFFPLPCVVTITRIAARALDSDNLQGSVKHVRDGVADALGVKDNDPRVRWEYGQRKPRVGEMGVRAVFTKTGKASLYGVEIRIEAAR